MRMGSFGTIVGESDALRRTLEEIAQVGLSDVTVLLLTGIEPPAIDKLMRYQWPGNVRELQNVIERAVILKPTTLHAKMKKLGIPPGRNDRSQRPGQPSHR